MTPTVTRAIRTKLIVPRGPQGKEIREALLETHRLTHEATRFCEELLLTFRQGDVSFDALGQESSRPAAYYSAKLEEHFQSIKLPKKKWGRAKELLKKLYALIVRSSQGKKTTAPDIERFFRPLFQPSVGGRPKPIHLLLNGLVPPEDTRKASALAEDTELVAKIEALFTENPSLAKNKKPSWDLLYREQTVDDKTGRPKWIKAFFEDWLGTLERLGGREDIVGELAEMGLLPYTQAYFARSCPQSTDNLWSWDRMALAKAVGHLNSWESWQQNVTQEKENLKRKVQRALETHIDPKALAILEGYQKRQGWEIRPREIRGWDKIRLWLQKNPRATPQQITTKIGLLQRQHFEYGSGFFLAWAASEPALWKPEQDPVRALAKRNSLEEKYQNARCYTRFTYTMANKHPTGVDYDVPSNSNNPKYELSIEESRLFVCLPLFFSGHVRKTKLQCAPSKQLRGLCLERGPKKTVYLTAYTQDRLGRPESFPEEAPENKGKERRVVGGAALTLEREAIAKGKLRDVYLRITQRSALDPKALKQRTDILHWFAKTDGNREEPTTDLVGAICLAVDLNQRAAAAVTAYRIVKDPSSEMKHSCASLGYGLGLLPLYSRILRLPGEGEKDALADVRTHLNVLRKELGLLRGLRKLSQEGDSAKLEKLKALYASSGIEVSDPQKAYRAQEELVSPLIPQLQTLIREHLKANHSLGGVSLRRIEFLESYYNVLKSWFYRATPEKRKTERRGFCHKLRVKTQKLKEDRAKKIADMIAQAARGLYWSEERKWEKVGPPATFVVMEELRDFLPQEERTPSQNRRLAQWNHRTVAKYVGFQLAEYGIPIGTTKANYTSLFENIGTPGIRCRPLTKVELSTRGTGGWLDQKLGPEGLNLSPEEIDKLVPGNLIPDKGASLFVTMRRTSGGKRHLVIHNADTNAASRIGYNFLTGYKEPVYLRCVPNSEGVLEAKELGVRLSLYFGASEVSFSPVGEDMYKATPAKQAKPAKAAKRREEVEDAAAEENEGGITTTLLRDPTGVFFRPDQWVARGRFFGQVKNVIMAALRERGFSSKRI